MEQQSTLANMSGADTAVAACSVSQSFKTAAIHFSILTSRPKTSHDTRLRAFVPWPLSPTPCTIQRLRALSLTHSIIPAPMSPFPALGTPRPVPLAICIDRRLTWRLYRAPPSTATGEQRKGPCRAMQSHAEVQEVLLGLTYCDRCCSPTEGVPSDHMAAWPSGHMAI